MFDVPNFHILSSSDFYDVSNSIIYSKYINCPFVLSSIEYRIIRSIGVYKINNVVYSYQVIDVSIVDGIQQEGIHIHHLFPYQFEDLLKTIEVF